MRAALKAIQAAAGGGGGPVYTDAGSSFADIKRFSLYTDGGSGNFTDTTFSMSGVSGYNGTIDIFVVGTISNAGYLKRTNLDEYKVQNRGGRGQKGATTRRNITKRIWNRGLTLRQYPK